jgi:hypothetical protein
LQNATKYIGSSPEMHLKNGIVKQPLKNSLWKGEGANDSAGCCLPPGIQTPLASCLRDLRIKQRAANFKLSLLKKLDKYAIFLLLCNCCTQLPIVLLSEHKQWLYMPQLFFFILLDALLY